MPRVTQREQYERHLFLRRLWTDFYGGQSVFGEFRLGDQLKIHNFYRPDEQLGFTEFKAHLKQTNREQPQLGHVAGKLFHRMQYEFFAMEERRRLERLHPAAPRKSRRIQRGDVVVRGIARPKPEIDKLIQAMRCMIVEEMRSAKEAQDIEHDSFEGSKQ
ncbi:hypothetical protein OK351_17410 [Glutamicibacter sp. MNS18]|uniref:hypothetical protein n=1 Tax=Glutamicibacter sp. MNS18 TaxID=2989817 RepID=UPI00223592E5|nr:hypothetical protein [Glutamicibacter sp. MNS18]MCW4467261.1 hypothetical protein [Glutamicibacter sp. MNS18]